MVSAALALLAVGLAWAGGPDGPASVPVAVTAAGPYPTTLVGGLGAAGSSPSPFGAGGPGAGGYAVGRLVLGARRVAFEAAAREGVVTADTRTVGALFGGARVGLGRGLYARGGFAHNHEVELALAESNPVSASLGSLPGIRHRSGAELGAGWVLRLEDAALDDRLGVGFDVATSVFPDANGPVVYGFAEASVLIGVGRRRQGP